MMQQVQDEKSPVAVGIFPQYAVPKPVTLVIQEATHKDKYSGADFAIRDTEGVIVCKVSGKSLSYSGQKVFTDVHGQPLCTLKEKSLSLLGSHEILGPDGSVLCDIDGKWKFASIKMRVKFTNKADGVPLEILITGNYKKRDAKMVLEQTGSVLATLSGAHGSPWKLFKPVETDYFVQVAPGVDLTLIAALAVAFDERQLEMRQPVIAVG